MVHGAVLSGKYEKYIVLFSDTLSEPKIIISECEWGVLVQSIQSELEGLGKWQEVN